MAYTMQMCAKHVHPSVYIFYKEIKQFGNNQQGVTRVRLSLGVTVDHALQVVWEV